MCEISVDELGPSKVILLRFPKIRGLEAVVVVDNTALGPAIGGVRVSPSVTVEEVTRLARTMTLKNSVAGLSHGGGKAGIVADPGDPEKERYFRAFARAIRDLSEYIPGPDMGSDERAMAAIYGVTGRAVGLPEEMGGIPLDRLGATGFGLAECAEVACPYAGMDLKGARVSVQGFGSVGKAVARFLARKGARVVAVSDRKGSISDPVGLDVEAVIRSKDSAGSVVDHPGAKVSASEDALFAPCDILVPAAGPDVINRENVHALRAGMVLEGANIPMTEEAERAARDKGILVVPDFIANAGGVIAAAMEYEKKTAAEAFRAIAEKIRANTAMVLEKARAGGVSPRDAALGIARERVLEAMGDDYV
ncbi:MAG: Glu/Leu/Phe/Val dehydrogenase [Thermodesulfovibrionales bacterium]